MLLFMLITKVRIPIAKAAKSTAFPPLIIEVEAALLHGTAGGALFLQKIGVYYISSFRTLGYIS